MLSNRLNVLLVALNLISILTFCSLIWFESSANRSSPFSQNTDYSESMAMDKSPSAEAISSEILGDSTDDKIDLKSMMSSEDPRVIADALRNLGMENRVAKSVLDIILQYQVEKKVADILYPNDEDWWKVDVSKKEKANAASAIVETIKSQLDDIYGVKFSNLSEIEKKRRVVLYGNLSFEKQQMLEQIKKDYTELLYNSNTSGEDYLSVQAQLSKEKEADIKDLLTESEYREFIARNGSQSHATRQEFSELELTEQEYIEIANIMQSVHDEIAINAGNLDKMGVINAKGQLELIEILGEDRLVDYYAEKSKTVSLLKNQGLEPQKISDFIRSQYDVFLAFSGNTGNLVDITDSQRNRQMAARFEQEASKIIGVDVFNSAIKNDPNSWYNMLLAE